jgi:predicted TIM-barrel fold metal-dependent hydrolase
MTDIRELAQLARNNPNVPVIFGHLGGLNWLETITLAKEIDNAYLDVSETIAELLVL